MTEPITTQKQAAKILKVSDRTIRNYLKTGRIKKKDGAFALADLKKAKAENGAGSGQPAPAEKAKPDDRQRQRQIMAEKRAAIREIEIGPIKNKRRRGRCRNNAPLFCTTYFSEIFYNPFTADQKRIISAIVGRIKTGGFQAIAAERGGGKSTIAKVVAGVWAIAYGKIKYLCLLGANGPNAEDILTDIKEFYEFNDRLADDFPEICTPIRALEGAAQRGGAQTVNGKRTRIMWSGKEIRFPFVTDKKGQLTKASGSIITTRGIDAAIRGLVKASRRPDVVISDDLETRESAQSTIQTQKRIDTLESDVLGLAGPGKAMPVLLLGTIIKKRCLIDQFTDRKLHPAWHGIRQKRLIKEPTNADLWAKYIELRQTDQLNNDSTGRSAHKFYLKNQDRMNAGAKISNPYRFNSDKLDDGSQLESSAIQACYNDIADMGSAAFAAEYQNEPADTVAESTGIELGAVQKKINNEPAGQVPAGCTRLTAAIDIGRRQLHWSVIAWTGGAIGSIIDYGTEDVYSPAGNLQDAETNKAMESAILSALLTFRDQVESTGWPVADSDQVKHLDLCLIDAGWFPDPVHQFCASSAAGRFRPSMGLGSNSRQGRFRRPTKGAGRSGAHWYIATKPRRRWYNLDVDYYKQRVHDGFLTPASQNGSISLYGEDPIRHRLFAEQIMAEIWTRDFVAGKGWKEGWIVRHRRNHYLDTAAANIAAAEILGIRLVAIETADVIQKRSQQQKRPAKRGGFLEGLPKL